MVLKKVREGAERTWWEFGLDSSKQFIGAGWIHILNLAFATMMGRVMAAGDECEWYWINIMVDTTLGVAVEYALLRAITGALDGGLGEASQEYHSGLYWERGEFKVRRYLKQLAVWLIIVTLMKLLVVVFMLVLSVPLVAIASFVLGPFLKQPQLKLIVVMIATPVTMNAFQFWVTDNFIKKQEDEDWQRSPGGGGEIACSSNEMERLLSTSPGNATIGDPFAP